jgi:hypothetical protein
MTLDPEAVERAEHRFLTHVDKLHALWADGDDEGAELMESFLTGLLEGWSIVTDELKLNDPPSAWGDWLKQWPGAEGGWSLEQMVLGEFRAGFRAKLVLGAPFVLMIPRRLVDEATRFATSYVRLFGDKEEIGAVAADGDDQVMITVEKA